jgi:hypothetical protein
VGFKKALVFWTVVLLALALLLAFVPAANSVPEYAIAGFLLVIAVGFWLVNNGFRLPPTAVVRPSDTVDRQHRGQSRLAEMNRQSFTNSVIRNIRFIPRPVLALMFGIAVVFALLDVAQWAFRWSDWPTELWSIAPYLVLVSAAEYLAVTSIVGSRRSVPAYLRYAATWAVVLLPMLIAVGLLFTAPVIGREGAILSFAVGILVAVAFVAFLPAWPVAQSFSPRVVMPTRVLRATRGFRWGLVGMALVLAAFNRQDLMPSVKDAHDLSHAFAYAAGEAGISTLSFIYAAALAATAFTFAARNDEGLYPASSGCFPPIADITAWQPFTHR